MIDYRACPNLVAMLFAQCDKLGDKPCLWAKRGEAWQAVTYSQLGERVRALAAGLAKLGIARGDRVGLIAENRPEWVIADFAIMAAGAITVPGYTTSTAADYRHLLSNSGARAVIVSNAALAERVIEAVAGLPAVGEIIAIDAPPAQPRRAVRRWDEVLAGGADAPMPEAARALTRRDLACLIYTSGTGGLPKGVMLSHGAILTNCLGAHDLLIELGLGDEVFLSFLPLSHSYEHTAGECFPLTIGAQVYFAEGADALAKNMVETRPTIMTAVPRLYETLHRRILHGVERSSGLKRKLFFTALELGQKRYRDGRLGPLDSIVDAIVDKLVRDKVRARFGGRLKALVSGGAALNPEIGLFFTALGLRLLQGYGQTESAPVVSCNPPRKVRLETVGPPLTDVEVTIAEDGEILVRGELVMLGYWNDPAATANAIKDGWLHTGDIGRIDPDGYLRITDRKKDFIKNSGGDMIAPAKVEGELTMEPQIAQVAVFGDRMPHLVAIVVPDAELARTHKPEAVREQVGAAIERANARLSAIERVRRFTLAREPFAIANEQMTPSLKVRRHKVREVYGEDIVALYK